MPTLEEFCVIDAALDMNVIGHTPGGMRIDFPFHGSATSSHWSGERPVSGIDYVTVRSDGNMTLDIHGVIGAGREKIAYHATGVSIAGDARGVAYPRELMTFATGDPPFDHLNRSVGVALGEAADGRLALTVYLVLD